MELSTASCVASAIARNASSSASSFTARYVSTRLAPPCGTRFAVEKPIITSPLPCPKYEPPRANPAAQRLMMRRSCRSVTGRSVAVIIMMEPRSVGSALARCLRFARISRPMARSPTCSSSRHPWLLCTSTPSV